MILLQWVPCTGSSVPVRRYNADNWRCYWLEVQVNAEIPEGIIITADEIEEKCPTILHSTFYSTPPSVPPEVIYVLECRIRVLLKASPISSAVIIILVFSASNSELQ